MNTIVFWQDIELTVTTEISPLSVFRKQIIYNLIAELKNYFNLDFIKNFDIFVPMNIPRDEAQFDTYGLKEIEIISNFFNLNTPSIKIEWPLFLKTIFADKELWCS